MNRVIATLAGIIAAAAINLVTPAYAGGTYGSTVQLTTHDAYWSANGCATPRYTIKVTDVDDPDSAVTWWELDSKTIAPDGSLWSSEYRYGSASSDSFNVLCLADDDAALLGTYRIVLDWTTHDADGATVEHGVTSGTFTYTKRPKASCRITVSKSAFGVSGWAYRGLLLRNSSPYPSRILELQLRHDGVWGRIDKKLTDSQGSARWHTARRLPRNRYSLRLRFAGNGSTNACVSGTFRLPRR